METINCATCENSRLVLHPDTDKAESVNIRCPDCSEITEAIHAKYLANPSICPWCGGALEAYSAPEVDEGVVTQEIDCLECGRSWQDVYHLVKIL